MQLSNAVRAAMNDAMVDTIDSGGGTAVVHLRTGSAPAATTDAAAGTLLATFSLPDPAFGASSSGVATGNAISPTTGLADGTVGHYRVLSKGGAVTWHSNSVGTSGTELVLNSTTISTGVTVSITSFVITQPAGSA